MSSPSEDLAQRTRHTLIERVKLGDEDGWEEFYTTYERLVRGAARQAGLADADQADVVQETMQHLLKHVQGYDRKKGSFRNFLFQATAWKITDCLRKRRLPTRAISPQQAAPSTSSLDTIADSWLQEWEHQIDLEWKALIRRHALHAVRRKAPASQYQIFDLRLVQNRSVDEVAEFLGVTKARVRVACSLTLRRVREEVRKLERKLG
jgi:RNA polymerase sigma factor (sigma-70 family)